MLLREYVSVRFYEDLLENRVELGKYVLEKVKEQERKYGIELLDAGIKDIKLTDGIKSGRINSYENSVSMEKEYLNIDELIKAIEVF